MSDKKVVAIRFDLPFYLRLPSLVFFSHDKKYNLCAILSLQRLGEKSFNKETSLCKKDILLDDFKESPLKSYEFRGYDYLVASQYEDGREIPTLEVMVKKGGGFRELRAYSEIIVYLITENEDPLSIDVENRAFENVNHFLNLYRLITQDPYIHLVNSTNNSYATDISIGELKDEIKNAKVDKIMRSLDKIDFKHILGKDRGIKLNINNIEDLFPGNCLEEKFLRILVENLPNFYEMPMHYVLILEAQRQLKLKNYHVAVIEAQTAFESYISNLVKWFSKKKNMGDNEIQDFLVNNMLKKRLRKLDELIKDYKKIKNHKYSNFVGSYYYIRWEKDLYGIRNKIVHTGLREISFETCKSAIGLSKEIIFYFEKLLPECSNSVQIYDKIDFIKSPTTRIIFE